MTCLNAMLLTSAMLASIAPVTGLGAEAASGYRSAYVRNHVSIASRS